MPLLPIDDTLSHHSLAAELILLGLTREQRAEHREGLREYVQWVLARKERPNELVEFDEQLRKSDASLDGKVAAGEITESQATQTKGDRIWWRVFEETRNGSLYIAAGIVIERKLTAYFNDEPVNPRPSLDEIQPEVERELATKLRQVLHLAEA